MSASQALIRGDPGGSFASMDAFASMSQMSAFLGRPQTAAASYAGSVSGRSEGGGGSRASTEAMKYGVMSRELSGDLGAGT